MSEDPTKAQAAVAPAVLYAEPVAPGAQAMSRSVDLTQVAGVTIRQKTQFIESFAAVVGVPWEASNKYLIAALPQGAKVATSPGDREKWTPTAQQLRDLQPLYEAEEESDACERVFLNFCGCGNLRNFKMHYYGPQGEQMTQLRPCTGLGAGCCCPVRSHVMVDGRKLGRVKEDCAPCHPQWFQRCCQVLGCCTFYYKAEQWDEARKAYDHKYTLRYNTACCGRTNNCCGATCFRSDAVFDVLDQNDNVVAYVQKTYGGDGDQSGALCRCLMQFSNYNVSFPEKTSHEERSLILSSVLHAEYLLFEKSGNENN